MQLDRRMTVGLHVFFGSFTLCPRTTRVRLENA